MTEDRYTEADIERCLVELKNKTGIWRPDLVELLQGQLRPLAIALGIDTTRNRSTVRDMLSRSLARRIVQIESVRAKPAGERILDVVFNLRDHGELPALTYTKRLEWLASNKRGNHAVPVITSRRLVDIAIPELAASIIAQYGPAAQSTSLPPSTEEPASARARNRRGLLVTISTFGVVVVFLAVTFLTGQLGKWFGSPDATGESPSPSSLSSSADKPYTVTVLSNADEVTFGGLAKSPQTFFFEKPASDLTAPPEGSNDCVGRYVWAHNSGGSDLDSTVAQFSVYANGSTVHILNARIEVVERLPQKVGIATFCGQGSPIETRYVEIGLGEQQQTIEYKPVGATGASAPFAFEIKPGNVELFQFRALSVGGNLAWRIVLESTVDGRPQQIIVDDNGKPFVTYSSSTVTAQPYRWHDGWKAVGR